MEDKFTNMTNEEINKFYDNMINSVPSTADTTTTEENITYDDMNPDTEVSKTEIPEDVENSSARVMATMDPVTGQIVATEKDASEETQKYWDRFTSDDEVSEEDLKAALEGSGLFNGFNAESIKDMETLMNLAKRRMNGEKFPVYSSLPKSLQDFVNKSIVDAGGIADKRSRSNAANALLNSYIESYKEHSDIDIDAMFSEFLNKDQNYMVYENMDRGYADIMVSTSNDILNGINNAINKAKEENNEDVVAKLESMKSSVDEAFSLNKFKEFCKTVKIKPFDLEKAKRYYENLNFKYKNTKNMIYDISMCPTVLVLHDGFDEKHNKAFIIAFCKYAANYNPDNFADHAFIYYFIRNIYTLNKINPQGSKPELITEGSKEFYDSVLSNIKECIINIKLK